jgi:hypothetical protein
MTGSYPADLTSYCLSTAQLSLFMAVFGINIATAQTAPDPPPIADIGYPNLMAMLGEIS